MMPECKDFCDGWETCTGCDGCIYHDSCDSITIEDDELKEQYRMMDKVGDPE